MRWAAPRTCVLGDAPAGLVEWALAEIERLEQCWSRFRPDSELAMLHARAGEWVDVSPAMLLALTCAADLHRTTADCSIRRSSTRSNAPATTVRSSSWSSTRIASAPDLRASPRAGSAGSTSTSTRRVCELPPGCAIDLGGLGKGLAADLVSRGLVDRGAGPRS